MQAYRLSVRLKLGLIVFAGMIALVSLAYTQRLVDRLRDREQAVIQLWADAQAQVAQAQQRTGNPYQEELRALDTYLQSVRSAAQGSSATRRSGPPTSAAGTSTTATVNGRPVPAESTNRDAEAETSGTGAKPPDALADAFPVQPSAMGAAGTQTVAPGTQAVDIAERAADLQRAVKWAQTMPPTGELNFILNEILEPNPFSIPAIITDSLRQEPLFWRNVDVPETLASLPRADSLQAMRRLHRLRERMDESYEPIPIRIDVSSVPGASGAQLTQYVHYDESPLVTELRWFPYIQLVFVGLFIGVGYVGFSYVRRSEQSNLWVGMAREAAHQLGTPISSLMGWTELLRLPDLEEEQRMEAVDEIEKDVQRLNRVAHRFNDIGSMPKLEAHDVTVLVGQTADYVRRRAPQRGCVVTINVDLPDPMIARVNEELFAWVVENLLKNALDAIEDDGRIDISGWDDGEFINIEVQDTGCGIDRREWRNIFRPGFSTKKRGWGLGLSLARRVIEDYHGGTLRLIDSTVGEGSTFRLEVPRASRPET